MFSLNSYGAFGLYSLSVHIIPQEHGFIQKTSKEKPFCTPAVTHSSYRIGHLPRISFPLLFCQPFFGFFYGFSFFRKELVYEFIRYFTKSVHSPLFYSLVSADHTLFDAFIDTDYMLVALKWGTKGSGKEICKTAWLYRSWALCLSGWNGVTIHRKSRKSFFRISCTVVLLCG